MARSLPDGDWKPLHPGYDFLEMIEKEKNIVKPEHGRFGNIPKSGAEEAKDGK